MRRWQALLAAVFLAMAVILPLIVGTGGTTSLLEEVFAYGAFAMSYDLLIGYTGVVSFGHAMFFGVGAYAVGIGLNRSHGGAAGLVVGLIAAGLLSFLISVLIAFISLRIRDTYFAMITFAVGQAFFVIAGSQELRGITNANDGITIPVPDWLGSDIAMYYACLLVMVVAAILLTRFVRSPVGIVLRGIRENEFRTVALGHPVFRFKLLAFVASGLIATAAGSVYGLSQSFVNTQVFDVSVSLNVLLMTIIGGIGTLYGGILGALLILVAQNEFSNLAGSYPIFNRYLIVFGVLYILVVRFLPRGILGTLHQWKGEKASWKTSSQA